MEKLKLQIDKETAQNLAYGDYDDTLYEIISNKIVSKSRWNYRSELIIKTLSDGKFWKSFYEQGATEKQDNGPYEYNDAIFEQVFPRTIEIIVYE